jgi:hypothetical protein
VHRVLLSIATLLLLLLTACLPGNQPLPQAGQPWSAVDVRALRLPDPADPDQDWIAAYARLTSTDLEIRLDRLSGSVGPESVLLAIDFDNTPAHTTGQLPFAEWFVDSPDLLITIPAQGVSHVRVNADLAPGGTTQSGLRARYLVDSLQDSLVVRLSRRQLPAQPLAGTLTALRMPAGARQPIERLGPLRLDAAPPPRAPLLLTFWDSLPAATPAQALRRWDGAHTGPFGQRHGLSILLKAAQQHTIPLALLDLARPEGLAALQALGGLDLVRELRAAGLLILPASVYGDPAAAAHALRYGQQLAQASKLELDDQLYGPLPLNNEFLTSENLGEQPFDLLYGYAQHSNRISSWEGRRLIPLPEDPDDAATPNGLSPAARTSLLEVALSGEPGDLLVLGGPLPRSPWADLLVAGPTLSYIANHPWIQPIGISDLNAWPAQAGAPRCSDLLCTSLENQEEPVSTDHQGDPGSTDVHPASLFQSLEQAPGNLFTTLAWHTFLALTEPTGDPALRSLRSAYLADVAYLLQAARWANAPAEQAECSGDMDGDGSPECVLSSKRFFLILSASGGRLLFAAAADGQNLLQLVGPRSQFAVGLGEPREWRTGQGLASDPQEIPGGFVDTIDPWQTYQVELQPGQARFFLTDGSVSKTYRLQSDGIQVSVSSSQPVQMRLPLAVLDSAPGMVRPQPWYTFSAAPTWISRYQHIKSNAPERWGWGLERRALIWLHMDGGQISANTFNESRDLLSQPEDPNRGYPAGHFLPFPLAVVTIDSPGSFVIDLLLD